MWVAKSQWKHFSFRQAEPSLLMKVHTDGASTTSGGSENQLSTDSTALETIPLSYTYGIPGSGFLCVCNWWCASMTSRKADRQLSTVTNNKNNSSMSLGVNVSRYQSNVMWFRAQWGEVSGEGRWWREQDEGREIITQDDQWKAEINLVAPRISFFSSTACYLTSTERGVTLKICPHFVLSA